ncbi:site-2 protease family protein [Novosphingobium sp. 9]|uniref:site-2 protease family protein n=1 Tax=Novosphingobium sp. 9 TaxID=2025349 RepID=UPI0021B4E5FF|nr:site-2 protease family protein [Novosphingobium sp. 9]
MTDTWLQAAALILPLILAIVFHEVAHGWTALALGDPTAKEMRRLSLNPFRHVDPFGTVILPGMLALTGAPVFGWAKPVPVDKWRLRNPRLGMMVVAAAGPLTNVMLALVGTILLGLTIRFAAGAQGGLALTFWVMNLFNFIRLNIFLALFNLLPIPPFDGSHIVEGVLPASLARPYRRLRRYSLPLLLILLVALPMAFPHLGIVDRVVAPPVLWSQGVLFGLAHDIAGA